MYYALLYNLDTNLHNFILNLLKKIANWIKIVYNIFIQWRAITMKVIVDEFIGYLETRHAAINTIASYERDILKFEYYFESQNKKIFNLNKDDMQEYLNSLMLEGKSNATISRVSASIKAYYK